jgi:UDP-N-acetylglucosamine transferase subunit ALG13
MIFVTVGTDLPFDRMVKLVDQWAREHQRRDVFAQIGETDWRPSYIQYTKFIDPAEFNTRFASASTIVAHAGMGTILSALHHGKPILVMPRRASLGEHRNEHQMATAKHLSAMGKVNVAFEEADFKRQLTKLESLDVKDPIGAYASPELIATLRGFILK